MKRPASMHFRRGTDRRIAPGPVAQERRRGARRDPGIQWIALFRDADPRELDEALADCEVILLSAGETLLRPGRRNQNVYILLSGKLTAYLEEDANPDTAIEILPSECIGELSAIDGEPISALVRAASDARILRLDKDVFWKRLIKLRGVAENLMTTLSARMRRANERALVVQRERLELKHLNKELDVARQLQAGMLPLQRPLFPGRSDVEVCGFMEPASKVGGDLFDAFFVDSRTLFICIGDVSGHGIAAALFMVRVIGLLRTLAMDTMRPDRILGVLNDRLCIGNDTNLFVTLFCGFLDVTSGAFVYSNGGHCAPMRFTRLEGRLLPLPKGMLVGASSGRRYTSLQCKLEVGETLLCYTDGVTEAEDPAGIQFSVQGCLELFRGGGARPLPVLLDSLYEKVIGHTGSRLLADDCTMLALRRLAA
ncbi:MAG: SpoIIE family protein phosphatase [Betaproteobacteria bacterium]|nr:SpoIIE family protein phosphatase [Betaproteobacteria bacterium]